MIPWLLVAELLSKSGKKLSELLDERMKLFPVSGEINLQVEDARSALEKLEKTYSAEGKVSKLDGLSVDMGNWRFNLRASNTEPLLRLNVESRGDRQLCRAKVEALIANVLE